MRTARRRLYLCLTIAGVLIGTTTNVGATDLDTFGRCLKSKGATFYGASWCPHCRAQRELLGEAMEHVKYVECAEDGRESSASICRSAKIDGYPTWTFADGSRAGGEQSLERLAARTGCALPSGAARSGTSAAKSGRAKVIEIP